MKQKPSTLTKRTGEETGRTFARLLRNVELVAGRAGDGRAEQGALVTSVTAVRALKVHAHGFRFRARVRPLEALVDVYLKCYRSTSSGFKFLNLPLHVSIWALKRKPAGHSSIVFLTQVNEPMALWHVI